TSNTREENPGDTTTAPPTNTASGTPWQPQSPTTTTPDHGVIATGPNALAFDTLSSSQETGPGTTTRNPEAPNLEPTGISRPGPKQPSDSHQTRNRCQTDPTAAALDTNPDTGRNQTAEPRPRQPFELTADREFRRIGSPAQENRRRKPVARAGWP